MQKVTIDPRSLLRLLDYGKPGSGKTALAATACLDPRSSPVLWIDAGGQPITIANTVRDPALYPSVLRLETIEDLIVIYQWLANGQKTNAQLAIDYALTPPYRTVVFDGFTHIQRKSFESVMGTEKLVPGQLLPKAEWDHYGRVGGQMMLIASKFYALPMHVIATALEDPDVRYTIPGNDRSKYTYYQPLFQGQTRDELPSWALNVGRIMHASMYDPVKLNMLGKRPANDPAVSVIQFARDQFTEAKDQHGLGDIFVNPTISKFLDIIHAKAPKIKAD